MEQIDDMVVTHACGCRVHYRNVIRRGKIRNRIDATHCRWPKLPNEHCATSDLRVGEQQ